MGLVYSPWESPLLPDLSFPSYRDSAFLSFLFCHPYTSFMFRGISFDTFREPSIDVIQLTGFTCFDETNSLFVIQIYLLADDLIM